MGDDHCHVCGASIDLIEKFTACNTCGAVTTGAEQMDDEIATPPSAITRSGATSQETRLETTGERVNDAAATSASIIALAV